MEDLFWTTLNLDGKKAEYHIIFENEEYRFIPKDPSLSEYRFRRSHDEWHAVDGYSKKVIDGAIEALEKYLLRQH